MRSKVLMGSLWVMALLSPIWVSAGDFFIDKSHSSANDNNPGTQALPWLTIGKANQALRAGDTVHIKAGTYNQTIVPAASGTRTQRITYRAFSNDVVTVSETTGAITLTDRSFITIHGIKFYRLDRFLRINRGTNNIIAYCTFDQIRNTGEWGGSRIYGHSRSNWIHHCTFSRYGWYLADDDKGAVLDLGTEDTTSPDLTQFNLIEDNILFSGGHHVLGVFGMYNVIRNNYVHNENWPDHGNRNLYISGTDPGSGRNLIEGNRSGYSGYPPDNNGSSGMSLVSRHNIVRRNSFYHNSNQGIAMSVTASYLTSPCYNHIYNNTFFHNTLNPDLDSATAGGISLAFYGGTRSIVGNVMKNNLFHQNDKAFGNYRVDFSQQTFAGNFEQTGDPLFVNAPLTLNPANAALPDLNLRAGSPCIDRGIALTQISSPTGSGSQFVVQDAAYFTDGWGIVDGDLIRLHGSTQSAKITRVDYVSNVITVDRDISWTQNQGLSLFYNGSAPDTGAFESGAPSKPNPPQNLRVLSSLNFDQDRAY